MITINSGVCFPPAIYVNSLVSSLCVQVLGDARTMVDCCVCGTYCVLLNPRSTPQLHHSPATSRCVKFPAEFNWN